MNFKNRVSNVIHSGSPFNMIIKMLCWEGRKTLSQIFPYFRYLLDKKTYSLGNSHYYNWNDGDDYKTFWIDEFIKYRNINPLGKTLNYISVFGPRNATRYIKGPKIFFTGEDIGKGSIHGFNEYEDYMLNEADLSLGFRDYESDNYLRFPLWIMQFIEPQMGYQEIKQKIELINKRDLNYREKFCSLISRHDKGGQRGICYSKLNHIGKIDCPSYFMHNIEVDLPDYQSKRDFLKKYRFNICLENHSVKGYITEKLIDAIISKCIPIYNGILTDFDLSIINQSSIIFTNINGYIYQKLKILSQIKKNIGISLVSNPLKETPLKYYLNTWIYLKIS